MSEWQKYIDRLTEERGSRAFLGEWCHEFPSGDPPKGYRVVMLPANDSRSKQVDYYLVRTVLKEVPDLPED